MQSLFAACLVSLASALPAADFGLYTRSNIEVYAQGKDEAINASGVAAHPAYKGFPSRGAGPRQNDFNSAKLWSWANPGSVPEGVNPAQCTPKEGQYPIVLIPGTTETAYNNWAYLGPKLADEGFCVYSFNHNPLKVGVDFVQFKDVGFVGDIPSSSQALGVFIQQVLELTGAERVDLVGHSQGGGALPYHYLKNVMSQTSKNVRKMIGVAPSLGTTVYGLQNLIDFVIPHVLNGAVNSLLNAGFNTGSFLQQLASSDFMTALHKGGLGVSGVEYVNIVTEKDNVLIPYTNSVWTQDGVNVTTHKVQDYCSQDRSDHLALPYSAVTFQLVLNSLLDRQGSIQCPANTNA